MSISVLKRPYAYCFSGNPVHYELYSSQAAADPTLQMEVRVQFKTITGAFAPTPALRFAPVQGTVKADIKDLLESLLTYEVPAFGTETSVQLASGHTGFFYLQFREISVLNPEPSWDESEASFPCLVVKGGLARFKYQGNNFFVNYFQVKKPFLTWQVSGRLAGITERMYLLYLHTLEEAADYLTVDVKVTFTDGTTATTSTTFNAVAGQCCYIPAGADQWQLQSLAAKYIHFWEITIKAGSVILSETFRYYLDNREEENNVTLHYRNSLSGLDSVRVRGVIETDLDYSFNTIAVVQEPDYYDGHFFSAQESAAASTEKISWKGDVGYLKKDEQDRLRDIFVKREAWQEISGKWWPMFVTTTQLQQRSTKDKLFSLPIQWRLAHQGDPNYTPDTMDIGSAVFESNVCQAFISNISVTLEDNLLAPGTKKATITFDENDPQDASTQIRYRYSSDTASFPWVTQAYAPIVINVQDEALTTLEIQGICSNGIYGNLATVPIDTHAPDSGGDPVPPESVAHNITNNSNQQNSYVIRIDGVYQETNTVFAHSTATFHAPASLANQKLEIIFGSSPSSCYMPEGSPSQYAVITNKTATFNNVTANNYTIIFY